MGQTRANQIENLAELLRALGNEREGYMAVQGGYTMAESDDLKRLNAALAQRDEDTLRSLLRVGVHADVQVPVHRCLCERAALMDPVHDVACERAALMDPLR